MLMGLLLLIIPLLGYQYLLEMKTFLIEGQAQAQLLTAKGIAANLHNRNDLFEQLPDSPENYASLPSYPLTQAIRLDGFDDDWRSLVTKMRRYGTPSENAEQENDFSLVLGSRQNYLYAYMKINDATPVYRHPGFLRLDNSDHVRISFKDPNGVTRRLLMTMEGPGVTSSYYVNDSWLYAEQGQPENRVQGFIRASKNSYYLEFRLPVSLLHESRQLALVVANVTDQEQRRVSSFSGTFPEAGSHRLSHIIMRSPELEKILAGLGRADARIWVFDRQQRVRATIGNIQGYNQPGAASTDEQLTGTGPSTPALLASLSNNILDFIFRSIAGESVRDFQDYDPRLTQARDDQIIKQALAGISGSQQRRSLDNRAEILTAAYPIFDQESITGAVVMEQSTQTILEIQRQSLQRVASLTLLSLMAVVLVVALFATRLAFRIRRLRQETRDAIDPEGRLLTNRLRHEIHSGDEIGDLARSVSEMLEKLHQYQDFIGTIPRTLRHEINNPLNTISTSLENLSSRLDNEQLTYLTGAQKGLAQINALVEKLAEAASLESAMEEDDRELIDFGQLLTQYLFYFGQSREIHLNSHIPSEPVWINAAGYRIEQLLDKLLENALDFNLPAESISISLSSDNQECCLEITNKGTTIDPEKLATLFDSMQSTRADQRHFGLGLYIAKLITQAHKGRIHAENLPDNSGVCFSVRLPLAMPGPA